MSRNQAVDEACPSSTSLCGRSPGRINRRDSRPAFEPRSPAFAAALRDRAKNAPAVLVNGLFFGITPFGVRGLRPHTTWCDGLEFARQACPVAMWPPPDVPTTSLRTASMPSAVTHGSSRPLRLVLCQAQHILSPAYHRPEFRQAARSCADATWRPRAGTQWSIRGQGAHVLDTSLPIFARPSHPPAYAAAANRAAVISECLRTMKSLQPSTVRVGICHTDLSLQLRSPSTLGGIVRRRRARVVTAMHTGRRRGRFRSSLQTPSLRDPSRLST